MKQLLILLFIFKAIITNASVSPFPYSIKDENKKKNQKIFAYSPGIYTPIGIIAGKVWQKGHGIYVSGRFNFQVFRKASYHFDGGAVDDRALNWYYTGEKKYSRWELNAGGILKLINIKEKASIRLYAGIGIEKPRYLYSFSNASPIANTSSWVEFRELGHPNLNTEAGVLYWLNEALNIHAGVSCIHKKHERMITFGIGIIRE